MKRCLGGGVFIFTLDWHRPKVKKRQQVILMSALAAAIVGLLAGTTHTEAEARPSSDVLIYSPSIIEALSSVIEDPSTRTYTYGDHTTIEIRTTVRTEGSTHKITYETYVNGTKDVSLTTVAKVAVLDNSLYHLTTPDFNGYVTSMYTLGVTRSVEVRGETSCAATPARVGTGFASAPVSGCGFNWSSTGSIDISTNKGKVLWSTPASVHIWGVQYAFDEARVSPTFATSQTYTTNILSGSMSFPGVYGANDFYQARVTFYFQN